MRLLVFAMVFGVSLPAQSIAPDLRVVAAPDRLDARIAGARAGTLVGLVLGLQPGNVPLPGGAALQMVPITVAGLTFADAGGVATVSVPYAVGQANDLTLLAQAITYDTSAAIATPGALQVTPLCTARVPRAGDEAAIVVLFGQSNAEGATSLDDLPMAMRGPHPQLRVWNDAAMAWQPLTAGVNNMLVPGMPAAGPEMGVVDALPAKAQPMWLVKCAVWGSSLGPTPGPLSEWGPQAGELYPEMLRRIDRACAGVVALGMLPRIRLVAMMQGETDALDPTLAAAYANHLQQLIAALRRDLGARGLAPSGEPWFRIGLIHPELVAVGFAATPAVRAAQQATIALVSNCDAVETKGLELQADHVHFAFAGSRRLGRMLVEGFVRL